MNDLQRFAIALSLTLRAQAAILAHFNIVPDTASAPPPDFIRELHDQATELEQYATVRRLP